MNTVYEIGVLHEDRADWLADLRQEIARELEHIGLHRSVVVVVKEGTPEGDAPAAIVYLASPDALASATLGQEVASAVDRGIVVIPVVDDLLGFSQKVPGILAPVNGYEWQSGGAARLARLLLEEVGIEDRQRRVFISHKREDGMGAAEQLHDRLCHDRFVPFIDRFAVRAGEPVQDTIADALEEHAFLLLLETQQAHTSSWVFDEVDYALSHTMGILILEWPGEPKQVPGSAGLPRLKLTTSDLAPDDHGYDCLTESALDRVVAAVEAAHANGIVRRRRMLVRSVEDAARASGCDTCLPLPGWRLLIGHSATITLVGVTARLPNAQDLQGLDEAKDAIGNANTVLLVHAARALREPLVKHLTWVAEGRDLSLVPENAVGGYWR